MLMEIEPSPGLLVRQVMKLGGNVTPPQAVGELTLECVWMLRRMIDDTRPGGLAHAAAHFPAMASRTGRTREISWVRRRLVFPKSALTAKKLSADRTSSLNKVNACGSA